MRRLLLTVARGLTLGTLEPHMMSPLASHGEPFCGSARRQPAGAPALATVLYRSRAVLPLSAPELDELVSSARRRNQAEAITGLLIYDAGQFLQWLEGPAHSLQRLWQAIAHDPRHTDIELLGDAPTLTRFFPDWAMQLGSPGALGQMPAGAAAARRADSAGAAACRPAGARWPTARADAERPPQADPQVADVAECLVGPDPGAAFALIDRLQHGDAPLGTLAATLFEPVARALGDLWYADACCGVDLTVGLCRLQLALRRVAQTRWGAALTGQRQGRVLVAPPPGEVHVLGAVLDAEVLWQTGWQVQCDFPPSAQALAARLADQWFDALDLTLSPVLRQTDRMAPLARTIAQARRASCNPDLRVVVGGRLFHERVHTAQQVGADAASRSAMQVAALIGDPAGTPAVRPGRPLRAN